LGQIQDQDLSIHRITQKVIDGFEPNYWKGRPAVKEEVVKFWDCSVAWTSDLAFEFGCWIQDIFSFSKLLNVAFFLHFQALVEV